MSKDRKGEFEITDEEIFEEEIEVPLEGEIIDALDFDELYDLIKQKERIIGSKQKYKADYLITVIEEFRRIFRELIETAVREEPTKKTNLLEILNKLMEQLNKITRKEELRFKVLQLTFREINKAK